MNPDMLCVAYILLLPLQRLLRVEVKDRVVHQKINNLHALLLIGVPVAALCDLEQLFDLIKQLTMLLINLINAYLVLFFP